MPKFPLMTVAQISDYLSKQDRATCTSFHRLTGASIDLAIYGLSRYIYFNRKLDIIPDISGLREIIKDAELGISIAIENDANPISNLGLMKLSTAARGKYIKE